MAVPPHDLQPGHLPSGDGRLSRMNAKALWSVVLPVAGWVLTIAGLEISGHVGSLSSLGGIQENNNAVTVASVVVGGLDVLLAGAAIFLAVAARRSARTATAVRTGTDLAAAGLVLAVVLLVAGLAALAVGWFLQGLSSVTF